MPDAWEQSNALSPDDPSDAVTDADGDAAGNLDEFIAGTDPRDAGSVFRARYTVLADGSVQIMFDAVAGKSYRIEASDTLAGGSWVAIEWLPAQSASRPAVFTDTAAEKRRFYRVVTPQ
jgi:hypothetical protein